MSNFKSQSQTLNLRSLAKYLDFANHHPDATPEQIRDLCQKVKKFGFHSAFVNPCYIALAKEYLEDKFLVGTVISFPLGQDTRDGKVLLAIETTRKGADELDVMMNVGLFKAGKHKEVLEEMKAVNAVAKEIRRNVVVKFIIETGFLTDEEIKKASELVLKSGADFVKTCSGWGPRGAKLEDVRLIREAIGEKIKIKVAGGIGSYQKAVDFIKIGANRIGTSRAIEIVTNIKSNKNTHKGE